MIEILSVFSSGKAVLYRDEKGKVHYGRIAEDVPGRKTIVRAENERQRSAGGFRFGSALAAAWHSLIP